MQFLSANIWKYLYFALICRMILPSFLFLRVLDYRKRQQLNTFGHKCDNFHKNSITFCINICWSSWFVINDFMRSTLYSCEPISYHSRLVTYVKYLIPRSWNKRTSMYSILQNCNLISQWYAMSNTIWLPLLVLRNIIFYVFSISTESI